MASKRPFTPEQFKEIYSKVPRLTVDLVIKEDRGIVLALRNLPSWNNQWHFPGGTVFYKETIDQVCKRVAEDELGVSVELLDTLGYIEYPSEEKERGFGWTVSLAVLCKITEGEIRPSEEASKVGYFKELPEGINKEQADFLKKVGLV
ncbi:MAG: NUDIX domain-containing protein [Patescibacteria group bacterium]